LCFLYSAKQGLCLFFCIAVRIHCLCFPCLRDLLNLFCVSPSHRNPRCPPFFLQVHRGKVSSDNKYGIDPDISFMGGILSFFPLEVRPLPRRKPPSRRHLRLITKNGTKYSPENRKRKKTPTAREPAPDQSFPWALTPEMNAMDPQEEGENLQQRPIWTEPLSLERKRESSYQRSKKTFKSLDSLRV